MKVVMVCGAFQPTLDGVADYTAHLASRLRATGVAASVVSSGDGGDSAGVELQRAARRSDLEGIRAVARVVERLEPDLVHVQFAPSAYSFRAAIGLLPLFLAGTRPLVTTLHEYGWWSWGPSMVPETLLEPLWRVGERLNLLDRESLLLTVSSSALIVSNSQHRSVMSRRFNRRPAVMIPVGPNVPTVTLDADQARRGLRQRLGASPDARVLAFFGFVHPVKGLPYLFEALARLRSRHPDLHLVVVGGFESLALPSAEACRYERELRGLLTTLELTQAVTFTGYLPPEEASTVLQGLAVLPFNAGTTTKSSSLLTVLVHGLPTVATIPRVPDPQLNPEHNLLFVPPRDPGALEAAIERLLTDRDLAVRLGTAGRLLRRQHNWATIADQHKSLYETLLEGRSGNRRRRGAPGGREGDGEGAERRGGSTMTGTGTTSILFVELLGGIGDLVLALPAIHALARSHAPAQTTVVTFPPAGRLLAHDPWVDETIELPRGTPEDVTDSVIRLREQREFDVVVCDSMYGRLERAVGGWGRLATVTNLWRNPPEDELIDVRFLELLHRDGLVDSVFLQLPPRITLTPQERAWGHERLERLLEGRRPRVLFIPDAGMVIKRWPSASWRALASQLDAELGAGSAVVAGDDAGLTTAIVADGFSSALPRLELRELAAVAADADVCVGPDTGPVRIAAAVGTPTVALYGPTTAGRFGLRAGHVNLDSPLSCSERKPRNMTEQSCWYSGRCVFTDRRNCVEDISVEVVVEAVRTATRPAVARGRGTHPPCVRP